VQLISRTLHVTQTIREIIGKAKTKTNKVSGITIHRGHPITFVLLIIITGQEEGVAATSGVTIGADSKKGAILAHQIISVPTNLHPVPHLSTEVTYIQSFQSLIDINYPSLSFVLPSQYCVFN